MKTLKQLILSDTAFQDEPFEPIIRIVKEWLTQKRQNALERGLYTMIYDDLLEELNQ